MNKYIDGFVLPVPGKYLEDYREVVEKVAAIWKEHGALDYFEYLGEDYSMKGIRTFPEVIGADAHEAIVFGWAVFASREARELVNRKVAADPRMKDLVGPLTNPANKVFDPGRMVFGRFESLL